jgi:hypothetical protein
MAHSTRQNRIFFTRGGAGYLSRLANLIIGSRPGLRGGRQVKTATSRRGIAADLMGGRLWFDQGGSVSGSPASGYRGLPPVTRSSSVAASASAPPWTTGPASQSPSSASPAHVPDASNRYPFYRQQILCSAPCGSRPRIPPGSVRHRRQLLGVLAQATRGSDARTRRPRRGTCRLPNASASETVVADPILAFSRRRVSRLGYCASVAFGAPGAATMLSLVMSTIASGRW